MDQEATKREDRENNARDGEIERVVERFAFHSHSVHNFAEVEPAAVSVVSFRDFRCDFYYLPVSTFYKTI